jgi:branched-chain amino acid aminotransferase
VGGNYAPTILPSREAAKKHGCSQVLWLYGEDHQVTEVGAMNIFFVLKKNVNGKEVRELVTAPLTRGDILPGVTRASVLELARSWAASEGNMEVSERFITMKELQHASAHGQLLEMFGAGTAAVVSPVGSIVYKDSEVVPVVSKEAGPLAMRVYKSLLDIQYGKVDHPWSVVVK